MPHRARTKVLPSVYFYLLPLGNSPLKEKQQQKMSLIENYGQPWLEKSKFPDDHDPHRCGTAPFVPVVNAPRQHSCGSYAAGFNAKGCNIYRPNYPDDLYLQKHGCEGLADCKNGVPPTGDIGYEGTRFVEPGYCPLERGEWWCAGGYNPPKKVGAACKEGFLGGLVDDAIISKLLWAGVLWLIIKYAMKKQK